MVKTFKTIDGKKFKLVYGCCEKRGTFEQARKLRNMGYRVRIIESMQGKKMKLNRAKVYLLYKSIKRKWEEK